MNIRGSRRKPCFQGLGLEQRVHYLRGGYLDTLIRGVFFQEPGLGHGVEQAVQRLLQRRVGLPLGCGS